MNNFKDDDFKLCYVDGELAFFTTQDITEQWGDDWNDAPYECNAGYPYEWNENRGASYYEIKTLVFYGPFRAACDMHYHSPSVQKINKEKIPWIATESWVDVDRWVKILPGTSIPEFIKLIKQASGKVYSEV